MFVVDFSQVTYSTLMVQLGFDSSKLNEVDEGMLRHMIVNCLRSYNHKYKSEYGEMVIACDNTSWRKDIFPYYKANRKKSRDSSELNWELLYGMVNKIRDEIKENLPYKLLHIDKAEADDIIGVLVTNISGKKLILSGDKDFIQLQQYPEVKQYDPTRKKWIEHSNPRQYLLEHIIRGDTGDGVPNILSSDNCLVIGERQKPITQKRLEEWFNPLNVNNRAQDLRNWLRNEMLIDLSKTPENIKQTILSEYNKPSKDRSKILPYFMDKKLKIMTEHISEF